MRATGSRLLTTVIVTTLPLAFLACSQAHDPIARRVPLPAGQSPLGEWTLDDADAHALAHVAPQLRAAYAEAQEHGRVSDALSVQINVWDDPADGRLMVDVVVNGETQKPHLVPGLEAAGMSIGLVQEAAHVVLGSVPVDALPLVAAAPDVHSVEISRPMNRHLEVSIPANDGSPGLPISMNLTRDSDADGVPDHTGAGVVVGVVDTGADFYHSDFRDPTTGRTRIRYMWDQTDCGNANPPGDAEPTDPSSAFFGCNDGTACGSEYDASDIDCELRDAGLLDPAAAAALDCSGARPVGLQDVDSHGTHVGSTAAGNGGGGPNVGVAPEADLVVVKFDFDSECDRNSSNSIINGIRYVFQRAADQAAVVNLSLGSDLGPHTGDTGEERGIDALTGPGRIVVAAAGNAARNEHPENLSVFGYPIHGQGMVERGVSTTFTFDVPAGYTVGAYGDNYALFDLWYGAGQVASATVRVSHPSLRRAVEARPGQAKCSKGASGRVCVFNSTDPYWELSGTDNEVWIQVDDGNGWAPASGTYTVEIVGDSNVPAAGLRYDAWMATSRNLGLIEPSFPDTPGGSDNERTVGSPATAAGIVSVAAYTTRNEWTDMTGALQGYGLAGSATQYYGPMPVDDLAFFSSRGGSRAPDGRQKPEIAAPGAGIIAAFSHFTFQDEAALYDADGSPYFYPGRITDAGYTHASLGDGFDARAVLQGTSMATPHATGGVALLLERDPSLNPAGVRAALEATANGTIPASEGADDWGYGRFDLDNGFTAVPIVSISCLNDASCSDGVFCNGAEVCDASHECAAGTPPSCDDGDACTVDSCEAASDACLYDPIPMCGEPPPPPPPTSCGNGTCDADESCDGRNGTTACADDCAGKLNGRPSGRYCWVGDTCEGPGCP